MSTALDRTPPPVAALPRLSGFYNHWGNGGAVLGWLQVAGDRGDRSVEVRIELGDRIIGRGTLDTPHTDGRFRLNVETEARFAPIDIILGRLRVIARLGELPEIRVEPQDILLTWMAKVAFNEHVMPHIRDAAAASFLLERLSSRFGPQLLADRVPEVPAGVPEHAGDDVTPLLHRVGTVSPDRSAILGREGRIFLYEGSNRLFTQYSEPELTETDRDLAERWGGLFAARLRRLQALGVPMVQTVIPEKSSAMPHLFPAAVRTPTWLFAEVERFSDCLGSEYLSLYRAFRAAPRVAEFYMRTDSHFSVEGAVEATRCLLRNLAAREPAIAAGLPRAERMLDRALEPSVPLRLASGDLTTRFFGMPLYEEERYVTAELLFGGTPRVRLVSEFAPQSGSLNGLRLVWRNPDAPIKATVVAFANSFFERGGTAATLSWWFKHLVSEFHFCWSKELDDAYVAATRPNAVICQTIERFLRVVPNA